MDRRPTITTKHLQALSVPSQSILLSSHKLRIVDNAEQTLINWRNRSESSGTTSMDASSQTEFIGHLSGVDCEDAIPPMNSLVHGSVQPRKLLRPPASASPLRNNVSGFGLVSKRSQEMLRSKSGTIPGRSILVDQTPRSQLSTGIVKLMGALIPRCRHDLGLRNLPGPCQVEYDGDHTNRANFMRSSPPPVAIPRWPPSTKMSPKGTERYGREPVNTTQGTVTTIGECAQRGLDFSCPPSHIY